MEGSECDDGENLPSPADGERHPALAVNGSSHRKVSFRGVLSDDGVGSVSPNGFTRQTTIETLASNARSQYRQLAEAVDSIAYQLILTALVLVNVVIVIIETDYEASEDHKEPPQILWWINLLLLIAFVVDIIGRMAVFGPKLFFHRWSNVVEFIIVMLDLLVFAVAALIDSTPSASLIRTLVRLTRLAKSATITALFPELRIMLTSLVGTLKALLWGCILLAFMVTIFAVAAVRLIHPINQDIDHGGCIRCPKAYSSVWMASLTILQQNIAGDAWGDVTLDVVERSPETLLFFLVVFAAIQLMVMNIILAMVVDSAEKAREKSIESKLKQDNKEREALKKKLIRVCKELDTEGVGMMRLEFLEDGIRSHRELSDILRGLDITEDDLEDVWDILQDEGQDTDEISYFDFADNLFKMKTTADHTLLIFIRHLVAALPRKIYHLMEALRLELTQNIRISDRKPPSNTRRTQRHNSHDSDEDTAKASLASAAFRYSPEDMPKESLASVAFRYAPEDAHLARQTNPQTQLAMAAWLNASAANANDDWTQHLKASLARIEDQLGMYMRSGYHEPCVSAATTMVANNANGSLALPLKLKEPKDFLQNEPLPALLSSVRPPDRRQSHFSVAANLPSDDADEAIKFAL